MIVERSLNTTLDNLKTEGDTLLAEMKIRENVLK